jgi:preprotein translocase subunit SecA
MNESIKEESVGYLFNIQVEVDHTHEEAAAVQPMSVTDMLAGSGLSSAEATPQGSGAVASEASTADALAPADIRSDATAEPAQPAEQHPTFRAKGLEQPERRPQQLQYSAPTETGDVEHRAVGTAQDTLTAEQLRGASRNGPCPCGSGKKFKMCHGKNL